MATIYPQIFGRERKNLELSLGDNNNKYGFMERAPRDQESAVLSKREQLLSISLRIPLD